MTGSNLHSLFDRSTDTAIDFPEGTTMTRAPQDPNRLEVTIPLSGRADIHLLPDYYVKTLGVPYYVPFDDSHFPTAPAVWCSWDSYAETTREEDIVQNVDWISAHLKPYGFQYVVLDDGYDRGTKGEHYWTSNWDPKRFPHGPKWLASYVKSKGLHPGIWLVPNGYAGAVEQHPDWYLRDRSGIVMLDYSTPALDSSNPEVLEFLKHEFETLNDWGFEYYKFDGEHAIPKYVPMVDTNILYNKLADPLVIYRNRLKLIRDTVGPGKFIEGCPAGTPLNGIGYFNSYFNGHDMYSSWQGSYPMLSSINANSFEPHRCVQHGGRRGGVVAADDVCGGHCEIASNLRQGRDRRDQRPGRPRHGNRKHAPGSPDPGDLLVSNRCGLQLIQRRARTAGRPGETGQDDAAHRPDSPHRSVQPWHRHALEPVPAHHCRRLHPRIPGNSGLKGQRGVRFV